MNNIIAKEILTDTIIKIDGAYAPSTIRAYGANFERFIIFCSDRNSIAIPANEADITSYIQHLIKENLKSASIRIAIASISTIHRLNQHIDPTTHPNVKFRNASDASNAWSRIETSYRNQCKPPKGDAKNN